MYDISVVGVVLGLQSEGEFPPYPARTAQRDCLQKPYEPPMTLLALPPETFKNGHIDTKGDKVFTESNGERPYLSVTRQLPELRVRAGFESACKRTSGAGSRISCAEGW